MFYQFFYVESNYYIEGPFAWHMNDELIPYGRERLIGVQLCAINARRLIQDSENVSDETSIVLLELALEEIAKGYMLAFRGIITQKDFDKTVKETLDAIKMNEALSVEDKVSVKKFYDEVGYEFFKELTVKEFKDHNYKLNYLGLVTKYYSYIALPAIKTVDIGELVKKILGSFIDIDLETVKEGIKESEDIIMALKAPHIRELKKIRENGLYVSYEKRYYFYPGARPIHINYMYDLANLLAEELEGIVNNFRIR